MDLGGLLHLTKVKERDMPDVRTIDDGTIIQRHKFESFEELKKEDCLFDFLPDINIRKHWERVILETWVAFFEEKGVPFVVVEYARGKVKLWKEKYT